MTALNVAQLNSATPYTYAQMLGTELFEIESGGVNYPVPQSVLGIFVGQYVDIRQFAADGYDPTGVNDSSGSINATIQYAVTMRMRVKIPPGLFKIASPILAFLTGASSGRSSIWIEGCGCAYGVTPSLTNSSAFTTLVISNGQNPGIVFNASYGCVLKNIGIVGQNTAPANQNIGGSIGYPVDTVADYISSGVSNTTYGPHCAVVIDPVNIASMPTGGYANLTYGQNTGVGSSDILLDNVAIANFAVGVACSVSGSGIQGDHLRFRKVGIQQCDSAYGLCSPNAHSIVIEGGECAYLRQYVDGLYYGGGAGDATPPTIREVQLNWCYRVFAVADNTGRMLLDNIYVETFRTIGNFGTSSAGTYRSPLEIRVGKFNFATKFGTNTVLLPPCQLETNGPTNFIDAEILCDSTATPMPVINFGGSAPIMFTGSLSTGTTVGVMPFVDCAYNGNSGTTTLGNVRVTGGNGFWYSDNPSRAINFPYQVNTGRGIARFETQGFSVGKTSYVVTPPNSTPNVTVSGVSGLTLNSTTVTFTCTNAAELAVGDFMYWQANLNGPSIQKQINLSLEISAISGTSVTATMVNDPISYDSVANQPFSTSITVATVHWYPTQSFAATANGTTSLTVALAASLKVGDWLYGANGLLAANTRVTNISGTTVTLNYAATGSGPEVLFWSRAGTFAVTPAF